MRDVQLVVTDGRTFADRERQDTEPRHAAGRPAQPQLPPGQHRPRGPATGSPRPTRPTRRAPCVLVKVRFRALTRRPLQVYVLHDPNLSNAGDDDVGASGPGGALLASDAKAGSALAAKPGFTATSSGYLGASDGWTDLGADFRMDWRYAATAPGNVVQTARTALTGRRGGRTMTLALGFGSDADAALAAARTSLGAGLRRRRPALPRGLARLPPRLPPAARGRRARAALRRLPDGHGRAGGQDATAAPASPSPSMAWVWGQLAGYSGPYHLVWSRDLYQVATAQIAAGDRAAAGRALDHLFGAPAEARRLPAAEREPRRHAALGRAAARRGRRPDPARLAARADRRGDVGPCAPGGRVHPRRSGPVTQERWENEDGYSPASIGARDRRARGRGGDRRAQRSGRRRDPLPRGRRRRCGRGSTTWTVTTNGPLSADPYFLRLSVDGNADAGDDVRARRRRPGHRPARRRRPELPRARAARRAAGGRRRRCSRRSRSWTASWRSTRRTAASGTATRTTATARRRRAARSGSASSRTTASAAPGRSSRGSAASTSWPRASCPAIARAARAAARERLDAIAATAGDGLMLPEQVWDEHPPSGTAGRAPGTGTGSSTPLGWTHAQFVRLAWSIDAGRPVERPAIVSCRYGGPCG